MRSALKILVVDDHPLVRHGLIQIISDTDSLSVIGEAGSGEEALTFVEKTEIDVVVTDFDMPGINGLELATRLLERTPQIPVVLLTMHQDEDIFNEAANRGVFVYLLKDEVVANIQQGIEAAARGDSFVSPSLARFVMRRSQRATQLREENTGLESLTPGERAVLKLVAQNKSIKEIASELSVSPHTISSHRSNISQKLGLSGKHPLLNFALANRSAILNLPDHLPLP